MATYILFHHSILYKVILSITSLIDISFFITSINSLLPPFYFIGCTNVFLYLFLSFFHSLDLNQLTHPQCWTWPNHLKQLSPYHFINRGKFPHFSPYLCVCIFTNPSKHSHFNYTNLWTSHFYIAHVTTLFFFFFFKKLLNS